MDGVTQLTSQQTISYFVNKIYSDATLTENENRVGTQSRQIYQL